VAFAADAIKIVAVFAGIILESTPHLYLSALPFAPKHSRISQEFLPKFPQLLTVATGKAIDWPAMLCILTGHTGSVYSVTFSEDGRRVVSGSFDETIHIWDAESGKVISGPLIEHTDLVNSVAFSQDGTHVVSGSYDKTIRIWDAESGKVVSIPFEGHTD
jgi:WD40 repeat protein